VAVFAASFLLVFTLPKVRGEALRQQGATVAA